MSKNYALDQRMSFLDLDELSTELLADALKLSFRIASQLDPWIVWDGYLDGLLIPNHLAAQGFYLLRARTQLREISNILQK